MNSFELIALIDHTRLEENDSEKMIAEFCSQAITTIGNCAAVCVYAHYIAVAKKVLKNSQVKIASVANFPHGNNDLKSCLKEMEFIGKEGADEIDIVLPYHDLILGNDDLVRNFLENCRKEFPKKTLKIIIESSLLNPEQIQKASEMVIDSGMEFIKTSTGKVSKGASLEAAEIILKTIQKNNANIGIKISGGVRTMTDAENYLALTEKILGKNWITPNTFRFGSSKLIHEILTSSPLVEEGRDEGY